MNAFIKTVVVSSLSLCALSAAAQSTSESRVIKTEKEVRFQVVQVKTDVVLKVDTLTGKTWFLQLGNKDSIESGVPYRWIEVPDIVLDEAVTPATAVRTVEPYSPVPEPNPFLEGPDAAKK